MPIDLTHKENVPSLWLGGTHMQESYKERSLIDFQKEFATEEACAHRGVSEKHLQSYPSEVCYRFNRLFWEKELFDRLMRACGSTETITYSQLVKTEDSVMS
jgi:hypothetical protein